MPCITVRPGYWENAMREDERKLLVSIPAPLNRTRAELRAARIAALRAQIREVEAWPAPGEPIYVPGDPNIRYGVTPEGTTALAEPDATGSC